MAKKIKQIFQFKITLKDIEPAIWRRIQVPENYSFWDLHVAIQNVMSWADYHLHEFTITNPNKGKKDHIGLPDDEFIGYGPKIFEDWEKFIRDYFTEKSSCEYKYDFGDGWKHKITLEKILPAELDCKYPICIAGARACPPEDCGGTIGYERFLKTINDPEDEEYEEKLEWIGGKFDPENFDYKKEKFEDPQEHWYKCFNSEI